MKPFLEIMNKRTPPKMTGLHQINTSVVSNASTINQTLSERRQKLCAALRSDGRQFVTFDYLEASGTVTGRLAAPKAVEKKGMAFRCESLTSGNERTFSLDRMSNVELIDFEMPESERVQPGNPVGGW